MSTALEDRFVQLHRRSEELRWAADEAFPGTTAVPSQPAPGTSALTDSLGGPRSGPGYPMRWAQAQAWWLGRLVGTEQLAFDVCAQVLAAGKVAQPLKLCVADQICDEGRHVDVFGRLLATLPADEHDDPWKVNFLTVLNETSSPELVYLALTLVIEATALVSLNRLRDDPTFPVGGRAARLVIADEARHVGLGRVVATNWMTEANSAERANTVRWLIELLDVAM